MAAPMVLSWLENECQELHESWRKQNIPHLTKSLICRSKLERQKMRDTYKAMYGEEISHLFQRVRNGCNHEISEAFSLWMLNPFERDAVLLRESLRRRADADYKAVVGVFAGRKSSHVVLIEHAYYVRYRRRLDQDILDLEPPHAYQKILLALAASHRAHHTEICKHTAKCDAMRLYEAGEEGYGGVEEAVVLEILSKRSIPQLKLTFSCYKSIYGHEYTKAIKGERITEFQEGLVNVVKCICNPPQYYAKEMQKSICGSSSPDKRALFRLVMSRAEIDMEEIRNAFEKKYGKGLTDSIYDSIPPGDYPDFLVTLAKRKTISACLVP